VTSYQDVLVSSPSYCLFVTFDFQVNYGFCIFVVGRLDQLNYIFFVFFYGLVRVSRVRLQR